jgi:hypothetical protein
VRTKRNINVLHFDGSAGLTMGMLLLVFVQAFSEIYSMPKNVILFLASANIFYGIYALLLAIRRERSTASVVTLSFANGFWAFVCLTLITLHFHIASFVGIAFLIGELLFVAFLATYEWKNRFLLSGSSSTQ